MTDELAYPIGRFFRPVSITAEDRARSIRQLAALPVELAVAIDGLSDSRLDTPYRPGGWTVRQVVHHLADSHLNAFLRIKLALTEDAPVIRPYDEKQWAELADSRLPLAPSLAVLRGVHERWVALLEALPEAAFARPLIHPLNGAQTVDSMVALYAWHGRHHVAHVHGVVRREGW